jgi:hypothetical protein
MLLGKIWAVFGPENGAKQAQRGKALKVLDVARPAFLQLCDFLFVSRAFGVLLDFCPSPGFTWTNQS